MVVYDYKVGDIIFPTVQSLPRDFARLFNREVKIIEERTNGWYVCENNDIRLSVRLNKKVNYRQPHEEEQQPPTNIFFNRTGRNISSIYIPGDGFDWVRVSYPLANYVVWCPNHIGFEWVRLPYPLGHFIL